MSAGSDPLMGVVGLPSGSGGRIQEELRRVVQHILPQQQPHQHPSSSSQNPAEFVINIGEGTSAAPLLPTLPPPPPPTRRRTANLAEEALPSLRAVYHTSEGLVPFLLLLALKLIYDIRLGFLVFVALHGTFYHSNTSLKNHVAKTENRTGLESVGYLAWMISFLSMNIFFVYYVFDEQQLYRSLYFRLPIVPHVDLWQLIWILCVTSFVIKFVTIQVKTIVLSLPTFVLKYKKKGKYYLLIETISQFYQSLVPLVPWFYFVYSDEKAGFLFCTAFMILYSVCKGFHLWRKFTELTSVLKKFQVDVRYGSAPSADLLQSQDGLCPICQEKFSDPVMLSCKHVFCEDCVSMWFSRENTCPLCRAKIVDNSMWRDGSTAFNVFLF